MEPFAYEEMGCTNVFPFLLGHPNNEKQLNMKKFFILKIVICYTPILTTSNVLDIYSNEFSLY